MADKDIFSDDEKNWLLGSIDLKLTQLKRALNNTPSGSSHARAILEDISFVEKLKTKVGLL